MASRMELHRQHNEACVKKCNKEERKQRSENDLCSIVKSATDGMPIRCVGQWAEQKIYLLNQYFGIFAQGMKNKWTEINYIEIFSGPGRCIDRQCGAEFDGTALSILQQSAAQYIKNALFFDYDTTVVDVLNKRIEQLGCTNAAAFIGDYNNPRSICDIISKRISQTSSLNLVLLDPTDCSVPFELLVQLKRTIKNIDIIINVATGTDFNRNIPMAFNDRERALKYCRFLGNDDFFTSPQNEYLKNTKQYDLLRERFRESYKQSLEKLGYKHFRLHHIEHYYDILFAAGHPKATQFWDMAQAIPYDGQRSLF